MSRFTLRTQALIIGIASFFLWVTNLDFLSESLEEQNQKALAVTQLDAELERFLDSTKRELEKVSESWEDLSALGTKYVQAKDSTALQRVWLLYLEAIREASAQISNECSRLRSRVQPIVGQLFHVDEIVMGKVDELFRECSDFAKNTNATVSRITQLANSQNLLRANEMVSQELAQAKAEALTLKINAGTADLIRSSGSVEFVKSFWESERLIGASLILFFATFLSFLLLFRRTSFGISAAAKALRSDSDLIKVTRGGLVSPKAKVSRELRLLFRALEGLGLRHERVLEDLSKRESDLESVLSALPVPTVVLDSELKIRFGNISFRTEFLKGGEIGADQNLFELDNGFWNFGEFREYISDIVFMNYMPKVSILTRKSKNSEDQYFKVYVKALDLGKSQTDIRKLQETKLVYILCIQDVSSEKLRERDLKLAQEKAQTSANAKSRFLASMSHEIRTPLNAIIGVIDLLQETKLDEHQKKYVDIFDRSSYSLMTVIDDVLDVSKLQSDEFVVHSAPFSAKKLLKSSSELMAPKAYRKAVEFSYLLDPKIPDLLLGDGPRLNRVVLNLLSNAVKFTHSGEVRLVVDWIEGEDPSVEGQLQVIVSDTGIGIHPESQEKIFDSFAQDELASKQDEKIQGTGLGLAIVKGLVERMGGSISLESRLGEGSTFSITLPFVVIAKTTQLSEDVTSSLKTHSIGIVDDNDSNRFVLDNLIRPYGPRSVSLFSNAANCVQDIENKIEIKDVESIPSVFFLDHRMPETNGDELISRLEGLLVKHDLGKRFIYHLLSSDINLTLSDELKTLVAESRLAIVQKPVGASKIHDLVRAVVDVSGEFETGIQSKRDKENLTAGMKILIAEDSSDNRFIFSRFLSGSPWEIEFAEKGDVALMMLKKKRYDLVLMDIDMPALSGFEVMSYYKKFCDDEGRDMPTVLALTAFSMEKEIAGKIDRAFDGLISKPVQRDEFLLRIANALHVGKVAVLEDGAGQAERDSPETDPYQSQYLRGKEEVFRSMQSALEGGHFEQVRREAHKIKGSAGSFGLDELGSVAEQIENFAREKDGKRCLEFVSEALILLSKLEAFSADNSEDLNH